jgi:hypothetical protein
MEKSDLEVEHDVLSFFFYADRVFKGLDTKKNGRTGLVSSAKKNNLMSTNWTPLLQDPKINKQLEDLPGQYYL